MAAISINRPNPYEQLAVRHYALLSAIMIGAILCLFVLAEALHVRMLVDPDPWLQGGGLTAGLTGVALLKTHADYFAETPGFYVTLL